MEAPQKAADFTPQALAQRVAFLEAAILEKDAIISEKTSLISEQTSIISEQTSLVSEKADTISKLTAQLEAEKFKYAQLQRMIFGSKRERFVSSCLPGQMVFEFEPKTIEIEQAVTKERESIRIEYERKKSKKAHPGRLALPAHLPVVETILEPEEDTTGMVCIGQQVTEELDYTAAKLHINRTIRPQYITKENELGEQKQIIAELNRPIHKCIASAALLAMIFTDKFIFHLPYYRIMQRLGQMGVPIPSSTFESWVKLGAEHIKPLFAVHRLYVFSEIYQQIDESPIKVLDKDKPGTTHQGYMWVRYAPLSKSVLFQYYRGRSAYEPLRDLSTFKGYIQTDGYSGYTHIAETQGITHLSCWAHARRYFDKALPNDQKRASSVLKLIQLLYAIEALARENNLTHQQRYELRLEKSLPIINEIGSYIYNERSKVLPKSPIGMAFEYCANRWISLQNYLKDGMLEIDSNLIENAIRPLALGRKNYLFAGNHDAAENIAMFYSFFGTCKKNDIDPQKWLTHVIKNINDTKASQLKELLPQFIDKKLLE
jgi:transposase